ncbi:hypothetical protein M2432_003699 [Mycobacterium sp. OTB74]|nr:hypothetical protein [Mycobacterium sp. OTB74]
MSVLREVVGADMGDPRVRALVDELSAASERFRELWGRADIIQPAEVMHMCHPKVGDLYLQRTPLAVPYSSSQHLVIYHAEPGSPSALALEKLHALASEYVDDPPDP